MGLLNICPAGGIDTWGECAVVLVHNPLIRLSRIQFIFSLVFIPPGLRYLERLWGSVETLKFIAVTIVFSNIITFGLSWIEAFLFGKPDLFLCVMYSGPRVLHLI
jgi:Eukaryotic integral membrane protein (DUF1751)